MIRIVPETPLSTPAVDGLVATDARWEFDPAQYESFIQTATGIAVDGDLAAADCYRIGNRLDALIAEHQQNGEWTPGLTASYPDIDSREEFLGLARFFRECHQCCLTGTPTNLPDLRDSGRTERAQRRE